MDDFNYSDYSDDELRVAFRASIVEVHVTSDEGYVEMDRDAVQRLHNILGEWLHPQNLGPTPYTLQQAITALTDAVNGAATAVSPLWNSPAAYVDAGASAEFCRGGYGCDTQGAHLRYGPVCGRPAPEADPEPHDVGHPDAGTAGCTACPHSAVDHGMTGCMGENLGFECACTRTKYAFTPGAPASGPAVEASYCAPCGHSWRTHWTNGDGCTAVLGKGRCVCTRTREASAS